MSWTAINKEDLKNKIYDYISSLELEDVPYGNGDVQISESSKDFAVRRIMTLLESL
jgi:hypothetical protein